jgi:hypothetical protein
MYFEIIGEISDVEIVAVGRAIQALSRLRELYGPGRWRKLKGTALIRLPDGTVCKAELHWYEAHAIGKREMKIKHILDE